MDKVPFNSTKTIELLNSIEAGGKREKPDNKAIKGSDVEEFQRNMLADIKDERYSGSNNHFMNKFDSHDSEVAAVSTSDILPEKRSTPVSTMVIYIRSSSDGFELDLKAGGTIQMDLSLRVEEDSVEGKGDSPAAGAQAKSSASVKGDSAVAGGQVDRAESSVSTKGDSPVAGGQVKSSVSVKGDSVAVGGQVEIAKSYVSVKGDSVAVGGEVEIAKSSVSVKGNSVAVGGQVEIAKSSVSVKGDSVAVGGEVEIAKSSVSVNGNSVAAGVQVESSIKSKLKAPVAETVESFFNNSSLMIETDDSRQNGVTKRDINPVVKNGINEIYQQQVSRVKQEPDFNRLEKLITTKPVYSTENNKIVSAGRNDVAINAEDKESLLLDADGKKAIGGEVLSTVTRKEKEHLSVIMPHQQDVKIELKATPNEIYQQQVRQVNDGGELNRLSKQIFSSIDFAKAHTEEQVTVRLNQSILGGAEVRLKLVKDVFIVDFYVASENIGQQAKMLIPELKKLINEKFPEFLCDCRVNQEQQKDQQGDKKKKYPILDDELADLEADEDGRNRTLANKARLI